MRTVDLYKTRPALTEREIREAFAVSQGYVGTPENEAWTRRALDGDPEARAMLRSCHRALLRRRRRPQHPAPVIPEPPTRRVPLHDCDCSACNPAADFEALNTIRAAMDRIRYLHNLLRLRELVLEECWRRFGV